jgi:hypothetical protein
MRRRTECLPFAFTKLDGIPVDHKVFGQFLPFTFFARPDEERQPVGAPVLEPWVLSVGVKVAFYNALGVNLGVTDYGGLQLQTTFVDFDIYTGRPLNTDATFTAFAQNERSFDIAAIDEGTAIFKRFYASNATSDGYPVPRACVPDSACNYPRTYYWPLFVYAELDPASIIGTNPAGGLPDAYSFRGVFTVDHEWRERTA